MIYSGLATSVGQLKSFRFSPDTTSARNGRASARDRCCYGRVGYWRCTGLVGHNVFAWDNYGPILIHTYIKSRLGPTALEHSLTKCSALRLAKCINDCDERASMRLPSPSSSLSSLSHSSLSFTNDTIIRRLDRGVCCWAEQDRQQIENTIEWSVSEVI